MKFKQLISLIITLLLLNACATYKLQYKDANSNKTFPKDKEIIHSFYLIGDAGNSVLGTQSNAIKAITKELSRASKHSTLLFLGDNIYPAGMPKKGKKQRQFAEHQLNTQAQVAESFKGRTIFIPGNHDWYANGLKGLKRQENYIENILGKNTFLPENGCPIQKVKISDDIVLIVIDSQWYLTNWDKHPTINDDCEIKNREQFFAEYKSLIKKARGKTTIIALHHPMFTNGPHGGQYSFGQHMSPLPVLGTLKNLIRKTSGITNTDLQNSKYRELKKRLVTLSQANEKVLFVSGHEHSLQYLVKDNLPQIVSGAGSKTTPTRNIGGGQFSYGASGYARLDVFLDGSSYVRFYASENNEVVFQTEVLSADTSYEIVNYDSVFPKKKSAAIYTEDETQKGKFYKKLWGERYRKEFSTNVMASTVNLDTLFGGLTPIRKGGGNQSKSLRLKDSEGREYVMRALRKNAVQYLQAVAFKDQYIEGQFNDTYTEGLLMDVFTGAHPYAPFTIATLSDAIGVYHTNPVLYYVPKQNALGSFNTEFGDELYMIEERPSDGHGNNPSFGFSNKIISTHDMLTKLRKNENHSIDEAAYIRARLFDMLIGDWDRHEDQWRWAVFKTEKKTIYRPIPRDRDQAFSVMADGALLGLATKIVPNLRLMASYDEELKSPKWFNLEPFPLDMALIVEANKMVWDKEVKHIVNNLTDAIIDDAFAFFPEEVDEETILEIKRKLKGRRANLQKISDAYYNHINKFAVIKGTDKDDWFEIKRLHNGKTEVTVYRIKKDKKGDILFQRTYTSAETKEIWIYGLDDKDTFKVFGNGDKLILIRLIGGQNKDTYNIENGKRVKMYDYKSKKNKFITKRGNIKRTDDYNTNVYNYKKLKNNENQLMPTLGANPDDGFKVGILYTNTNYGFERNPFTTQHTFSGSYYFATNGFDFKYTAEFANVIGSWNLAIETIYTSPNYSINFFGFGNETGNPNKDDETSFNLDYNRVKISNIKFSPSLIWKGELGANFKIGLSYESIEVEETTGRFINTFLNLIEEGNRNDFFGAEASYNFVNKDNKAFPTLGFQTSIKAGYKTNVDDSKSFGYVIPSVGFNYKLVSSGQFVLATKVKAHINLGKGYEFYQAASLGASDGLRGYRNQRFTGKNAFYHSTDLRLNLRKLKTGILPVNIGFFGGLDYGRVWIDGEDSSKWNNSYGGGIFANMAGMMSLNVSAFNSNDGLRFSFSFGFGF